MENFNKKIFNKVKEDIIKLIHIERERERERERRLVFALIIEANFKSVIIFMLLAPKPLKKKISYQESFLTLPPKIPLTVMKVPHIFEPKKEML